MLWEPFQNTWKINVFIWFWIKPLLNTSGAKHKLKCLAKQVPEKKKGLTEVISAHV